MNDFTKKFSILANKARGAIAGNRVARRIISATIALSVILSPLTPELTVFAAENVNPDETIEETASEQTEPVVTEAILPTESLAPDFSNYAVDEPLLAEDEDIDVTDPSDSIDTTAPPTEQIEESTAETTAETSESREATETSASDTTETTPDQTEPTESSVEETAETTAETEQPVEETKSNIVMATSADEYFDLENVNYYLFVQLSPKEGFVFGEHPVVYFDGNDSIFGYGAFTGNDYRVYTVDYQVTNPTSVADQSTKNIALHPNPVEDVLYLDITNGTPITVFDMTGRMVKRERYEGQLDVRHLTPAIYTIKAKGITVRFVKE